MSEKTIRPTMCTIFGVLAVIGAIFGAIAFLTLGGFSLIIGILGEGSVTLFMVGLSLLMLIGLILIIGIAVGFFGMKKWLPMLVNISLAINFIQYLMKAFGENGSFSSGLVSLAISIAIVVYVQSNKDLFIN